MADELEYLTTNAAGDSWVDPVPGAVSTGYQAQNTTIEAGNGGLDNTLVSVIGSEIRIEAGGTIQDVNGAVLKITSAVDFAVPAGRSYIGIIPGTTAMTRTLKIQTVTELFSGYGGIMGKIDGADRRVMKWMIYNYYGNISATCIIGTGGREVTSGQIGSIARRPTDSVRYQDVWPVVWSHHTSFDFPTGETSSRGIAFAGSNIVSAYPNTIYIHDGETGSTTSSFPVPGGHEPSGLTVADGNLIIGTDSGNFYKMDGISSTILETYTVPAGVSIGGLTYDGIDLLICGGGIIYRMAGISGTVEEQFIATGVDYDLAFDGRNLISLRFRRIVILKGISPDTIGEFSLVEIAENSLFGYITYTGRHLLAQDNDSGKTFKFGPE